MATKLFPNSESDLSVNEWIKEEEDMIREQGTFILFFLVC